MKVSELLKALEGIDINMNVYVPSEMGDYDFGEVHSAGAEELYLPESNVPDDMAMCFVLRET